MMPGNGISQIRGNGGFVSTGTGNRAHDLYSGMIFGDTSVSVSLRRSGRFFVFKMTQSHTDAFRGNSVCTWKGSKPHEQVTVGEKEISKSDTW